MTFYRTALHSAIAGVALALSCAVNAQKAEPTGASVATAPGAFANLPAKLKSPTDTAQFRRFVLENGLKVLLVSDQKFNKSGASLVVRTGQIDDPKDTEGLAHFLEHMLFLGTKKYPDVHEYGNFVRSNGGYNNAYTTSDHTNYQFEIRHEALAGALDRFSQFFIAPSFNADFTAREVNAVHNEAMRHVQNDQRRMIGVAREIYDPASGESKFSTGNKDTLKGATPERVRTFYEQTYSADRMALSIVGKASLDELEKHARSLFADVPKRPVTNVDHQPTFLPRKAALRMAFVEPVVELRQMTLEFVIPSTRSDFAAKPGALVSAMISYPGPGGLQDKLKRDGLIVSMGAGIWERTSNYGSLNISIALTEAGQKQHMQVLQAVHSYLAFLRSAPFPAQFFKEQAKIALLKESYDNRGEGAQLATDLANAALFYPLEIAERASVVWGQPDEGAYRRLLGALTPDNSLVMLAAKGVPTDKKERIYGTAYSYTEDAGAAYASLSRGAKIAFSLPGDNPFIPTQTALLAERPMAIINEPGLHLYYAPDTEFQRPQTTMVLRFVPAQTVANARNDGLAQLYALVLADAMQSAISDATLAGVTVTPSMTLGETRLTVTGFGDSPARVAEYFASQVKTVEVSPSRFAALKDLALRGLRSYHQLEARLLATGRRDALARQTSYLPPEYIKDVEAATLADMRVFAKQYFAKGKIEALVHGHTSPIAAANAARSFAKHVGAASVPANQLLRRKNLALNAGEHVIDAGAIEGPNSVYLSDYLLDDEKPATRAAAAILTNFVGEAFFSELRTKQQLGYIVGASFSASDRERFATSIIQSSTHAPDALRERAEAFMATLPDRLAKLTDEQFATLVAGARSNLEQLPKSIAEKSQLFFSLAYTFDGEWERRQEALAALNTLTKAETVTLLKRALDPTTAKRRTVLLNSKAHTVKTPVAASFADRAAWKVTRQYR